MIDKLRKSRVKMKKSVKRESEKIKTKEKKWRLLRTILFVTLFSINYNKTHKSWLKHEIKHDLYTIAPKMLTKKLKKLSKTCKNWTLEVLSSQKPKN